MDRVSIVEMLERIVVWYENDTGSFDRDMTPDSLLLSLRIAHLAGVVIVKESE